MNEHDWRKIADDFYQAAQLARLGVMYKINEACDRYEALLQAEAHEELHQRNEDEDFFDMVYAFMDELKEHTKVIHQELGKTEHGTPSNLSGADILLAAHHLITGDRNRDYSHPVDDYTKVVNIFRAFTGIDLTLSQAILFMLAIKFSRIRSNLEKGILHYDSVADAAGYLGCLNIIHENNVKGTQFTKKPPND